MLNKIKYKNIFKRALIIIALVFLVFPHFALAQETPGITSGCSIPEGYWNEGYEPIVINFSLPGVTTEVDGKYQVKNLQCFIVGIYVYFSGVAGILATVMIMYGGVKYVISMGNPSRMGDAKDTIFSAVVGLVLVLGAYVLLNLINPNITTLKVPGLDLANIAPVPEECTADAVPDVAGKTSCGDHGTLTLTQDIPSTPEIEKVTFKCVYKGGCEIGMECRPEEPGGRYDCLEEQLIWHGTNMCTNNKSMLNCGSPDTNRDCTSIRSGDGEACIAIFDTTLNYVKVERFTVSDPLQVYYPTTGEILNVYAKDDYNCGSLKENATGNLLMGTECFGKNKNCVVMFVTLQDDNIIWATGGLNVPDAIGNFKESYCR
ncbi:MAG: pilin [Candidatus Kerfeldbacteria bacterium]|jgi:type IV secretion system pilin